MNPSTPTPTLFLIDAHTLLYQVFHAIKGMSGPSGLPTNAIYGFARDMMYLRNDLKPEYLIVVFDAPGKTFRDDIYPEYKAHRSPMPEELQLQLQPIRDLLKAMRLPVLAIEGVEADDVIATLASKGAEQGMQVFICSTDKDCRQLLNDQIKVYDLRKRAIFDRASLKEKWGIAPEQVVDFQALVGDSVDNVPGVAGIGEKTAAMLLKDYQTLDQLLQNIDKVAGKKKQESLEAAKATVGMTRELLRLKTDVPVPLEWDKWRIQEWDAPNLLALFREWGFRGFAEQVRTGAEKAIVAAPVRESNGAVQGNQVQGSLFDDPLALPASPPVPKAPWHATYHLVETEAKFAEFLKDLQRQSRFALDLETTGLDPRRCDIVGLAFCWQQGEAWYLPVRAPEGEPQLDPKATLENLRPILENPAIAKVNQNIKYDEIVLREQGIALAGVTGDSMVAHYLLHPSARGHNMDDLSKEFLQHEPIPITDLIGKRGKKQKRMDEVPSAQVAEYAGEDADVALRLVDLFEPQLARDALKPLYDDLEVPLIEVLAELEFNGIRLDVELLQKLGIDLAKQLAILEAEIYELAGHPFNIASLNQLRDVLFTELGLSFRKKTGIKGLPSTDQETLEELALGDGRGNQLARKVLEQRKIAKLKGTYVDALPELVNPATGRIHASFNQTVAATGRLSSSDPNLQNIPIRSDLGGQIRQAFIPEPGWRLLTADYSQIELRLLAHFCQDEVLGQAFAEDRDIHALVAAQVFKVSESEVTPDQRRMAKAVNFGIIYGMSAMGLARRLSLAPSVARKFIEDYFARYPKVLAYQDNLLKQCRQKGYVATILGRRRPFDAKAIRPHSTYEQRNQAEREAINMEIQGSAADLIKVAMLSIHRRLKAENRRTRMLLQIHDELVFETPPEELAEVADVVRTEMTGALADRVGVPLKVEVAAGPNWLDVSDL